MSNKKIPEGETWLHEKRRTKGESTQKKKDELMMRLTLAVPPAAGPGVQLAVQQEGAVCGGRATRFAMCFFPSVGLVVH